MVLNNFLYIHTMPKKKSCPNGGQLESEPKFAPRRNRGWREICANMPQRAWRVAAWFD
jgi:hypothetical protein